MFLQSAAMVAKKLLLDDKVQACAVCNVSNRKTSSGKTFCFLKKRFLSIFEFSASSNSLFFLRAADWPSTNFLGMCCYFSVIRLINFVCGPRLQ